MGYYDDWVDPNGTFRGGGGRRSIGALQRLSGEAKKRRREKCGTVCPHCKKKFMGLEDHIAAKHPEESDGED